MYYLSVERANGRITVWNEQSTKPKDFEAYGHWIELSQEEYEFYLTWRELDFKMQTILEKRKEEKENTCDVTF